MLTTVPLAPGEEWGQRWEFNTLVEARDIDFARCTLPNLRDGQDHGDVRHAQSGYRAALHRPDRHRRSRAHDDRVSGSGADGVQRGHRRHGPTGTGNLSYLSEFVDMRDGKVWPNDRPGLGITLNMAQLTQAAEYTTSNGGNPYQRRDGSPTRW